MPGVTMRVWSCLLLPALLLSLPAAAQQAPAGQNANPPVRHAPAQPARQPAQQPAHKPAAQQQQQPRRPQQSQSQRPQPAAAPAPVPAPVAPPSTPAAVIGAPGIGTETRLPLPRFAALDHNMVNLRVGPGTNYPTEWTYRRRDLPVEIVSEFQNWRQIRDQDGTLGWVRSSSLSGRRTFIVKGAEVVLRRRPENDSSPVAKLMPGVVGRVRACAEADAWCEVQAGDYRGYLPRSAIWGVTADEVIGG